MQNLSNSKNLLHSSQMKYDKKTTQEDYTT